MKNQNGNGILHPGDVINIATRWLETTEEVVEATVMSNYEALERDSSPDFSKELWVEYECPCCRGIETDGIFEWQINVRKNPEIVLSSFSPIDEILEAIEELNDEEEETPKSEGLYCSCYKPEIKLVPIGINGSSEKIRVCRTCKKERL